MASMAPGPPRSVTGATRDTKPLRIVIAEDEAIVAVLLGEMLEALGHTVCAIEATELGLVMAATRLRPDLLVVDVQLRGGSGLVAMEHVLEIGFVPHVLISGATVAMPSAGAVTLQKPFWESDIVDAIARALAAGPPADPVQLCARDAAGASSPA